VSLAELLPAIRALPKSERVQLLHLLIDEVAEAPTASLDPLDALTEEMRKQLPPGYVAEVWVPEANPADVAAALRALKEFEGRRE
jgi:hypothetical protein